MADKKFKLPRSSYAELCRVITAYGLSTEPASLDHIAQVSGVGRTGISANNSFLMSVNIIDGTVKKMITEQGRGLARALEHDIEAEIQKEWREIIRANDFLNKMVLAVKIRKGMDIPSFETHIAYSAGEAKKKDVMTGARAVIDILKKSGLVQEVEDKIQISDERLVSHDEKPVDREDVENDKGHEAEGEKSGDDSEPGLDIRINVNINVSVSELDELGDKILDFKKKIKSDNEISISTDKFDD